MSLQFKLLGSLSIETGGVPSDLLKSPKGCALVTYLIVTGQPHSREFLADLFWEADSTSQALRNLRALIIRIRDLVPELQVTRNNLAFQLHSETSVDFLRLRAALDLAPAQMDDSQLDAALQLYCGDLLANFYLEGVPHFEEWLALERENLRQRVFGAYQRLCRSYLKAEQWDSGLVLARRWLSLDPLTEEAVRACMQSMAVQGEPGVGLQQYESFRQQLWRGFELEPEPATALLAVRLKELLEEQGQRLTWEHINVPALPEPGELPDPGILSSNSILPYRRNPDFTGRKADLLTLAETLFYQKKTNTSPTVAITGMGGLGKTQLAVEFAYRYGRYFSGGVYWMRFANPDEVPSEIATTGGERGLGLYQDAENLTLTDQVARVQRAWQEPIPRLLIFDNCEMEELLEQWQPITGGCRILLTSRRAEWSHELNLTCLPLDVLYRSESAHLLQSLAPDLGQTHADKIAAEVGDLPLALHMAGSFLARYHQISPAVYLNQLRGDSLLGHPSLQGHGINLSPTGHELNVVRTYALSWEKLNPANQVDSTARQLLACAACLAPAEPIPAEWLKTLVHADSDDLTKTLLAEDGLSRLITLGFLKKEGQTVVLHPLLASFTSAINEEKVTERARMAVGTLMAQTLFEHRQKEGHLSILPVSSAHLRHISEDALSHKTPVAVSLATLLGLHLLNISERIEAQQILERACMLAEEIGDILGHARALVILAGTQENLGHDDESLQSAKEAVELFKKADGSDASGLAEAFYRQGWAHYRLGQAKAALNAAEEGYRLSQRAHLRGETARCLNLMGVVNYYMLDRYDTAQEQLEESLVVYRQMGNRQAEAIVLNNMGENARLQGNYSLAAGYYEQALSIAWDSKNQNKVNTYVCNLCSTRVRLGQFEAAIDDLERLIAKVGHDWFGLSEAHRFLSEAYLGQSITTRALEMAQKALALAYPTNPFEHGCAWRVLALVAVQLGEPIQSDVEDEQTYDAGACFRRSLDFFKAGEFERDRAITLWRWAQYELEQGNEEQGGAMWQKARVIFTRLNLPLMVARMQEDTNKR